MSAAVYGLVAGLDGLKVVADVHAFRFSSLESIGKQARHFSYGGKLPFLEDPYIFPWLAADAAADVVLK